MNGTTWTASPLTSTQRSSFSSPARTWSPPSRFGPISRTLPDAFAVAAPSQPPPTGDVRATRAPDCAAARATCRAWKTMANCTAASIIRMRTGVSSAHSIDEAPASEETPGSLGRTAVSPC